MVGDDPEGDVGGMALAVAGPGDLSDFCSDVHHGVHIEQGGDALAHGGQALQAHAGVDVFLLQLSVVVFPVVVELGEHHVPDLHIAVAVAAHGAAGLAAAILGTAVIVDLGAWAAGTGAVLPEVVLLAELEDALGGDADLLVPDPEGLVIGGGGLIAGKDGGVEPLRVQAHPLRAGQKFPGPVDGVPFEVVAEGEVAQHLKISAVAGGLADVFDVAGADALLAGADPVAGGLLLAGEVGLHGAMPLLMSSREASSWGTREKLGRRRCSLLSKKARNISRNSFSPKGLGSRMGITSISSKV